MCWTLRFAFGPCMICSFLEKPHVVWFSAVLCVSPRLPGLCGEIGKGQASELSGCGGILYRAQDDAAAADTQA
jgi:hypothetical protein